MEVKKNVYLLPMKTVAKKGPDGKDGLIVIGIEMTTSVEELTKAVTEGQNAMIEKSKLRLLKEEKLMDGRTMEFYSYAKMTTEMPTSSDQQGKS